MCARWTAFIRARTNRPSRLRHSCTSTLPNASIAALAYSFALGIIYHPECFVRRSCVKSGDFCLPLVISFFTLAAFSTASAQAPSAHKPQPQRSPSTLEGHWTGSLQAGEAVLHLVLHVST